MRTSSKKRLDHVLGLALVQPDLLEQQVGQLGLGQRHHDSYLSLYGALRRIRCSSSLDAAAPRRHLPPHPSEFFRVSCITPGTQGFFCPLAALPAVHIEQRRSPARCGGLSASQRIEQAPGPGRPRRPRRRCRARTGGNLEDRSVRPAARRCRSGSASSSNSDRRLRQLVLLLPARMQLADPAGRARRRPGRAPSARDAAPDAAPARSAARSGAQQRFEVALHVEEIDRPRRRRPTAPASAGAEGRGRDAHRLAHAATSQRAVRRRRIAQEHAADLEHPDARQLAVEVVARR